MEQLGEFIVKQSHSETGPHDDDGCVRLLRGATGKELKELCGNEVTEVDGCATSSSVKRDVRVNFTLFVLFYLICITFLFKKVFRFIIVGISRVGWLAPKFLDENSQIH